MKNIILIDLDETLLDFKADEKAALTKTLTTLGIEPSKDTLELYSRINSAQWKRLEKREITREQVKENRYRLLFEALGKDTDPQKANEIYEKELAKQGRLLSGAREALERLYGKVRLFIASNGTVDVQNGRINNTGIGKYFEKAFFSEKIGFEKPDKRFFDACFAQIPNFKKENAVIIGDSLSSDSLGGKNAGITTVWLNKSGDGSPLADMTLKNISEAADAVIKGL